MRQYVQTHVVPVLNVEAQVTSLSRLTTQQHRWVGFLIHWLTCYWRCKPLYQAGEKRGFPTLEKSGNHTTPTLHLLTVNTEHSCHASPLSDGRHGTRLRVRLLTTGREKTGTDSSRLVTGTLTAQHLAYWQTCIKDLSVVRTMRKGYRLQFRHWPPLSSQPKFTIVEDPVRT